MLKYGLIGNPNCGKTALFNCITKSTAHVGNWAGVTVEKREGIYNNITIVDLPGIYSLSPYTPEEVIVRNFVINDTPNLIINIIDATNIERNLYLTTQLLELDCPIVIALNMIDIVEKNGDKIDIKSLEDILKIPVIPISALNGQGIDILMERAYKEVYKKRDGQTVILDSYIKDAIIEIENIIKEKNISNPLFNSIKILEKDFIAMKYVEDESHRIFKIINKVSKNDKYNDFEAIIADLRYKYITKYCSQIFIKNLDNQKTNISDNVDKFLTNKYFGIPIFILFMFIIFHFTFSSSFFGTNIPSPGVFLKIWTEGGINYITNRIAYLLEILKVSNWIFNLIIDGIIGGVGAVVSFIPQMLCLFLFLSILEDSGYMSRVAFIMDRLLRSFGLSGRSFIPLLMGFGCSVPAIMGTRILENEKTKKITMLIIPFFSCGAKLPIYAIFTAAVFPYNSDIIIFLIYILGIIVSCIFAALLNKFIFKDIKSSFIMELPKYHIPKLNSLLIVLSEKLKGYIVKAGTTILIASVIIWFLSNFSFSIKLVETNSSNSIMGILSKSLVPIFKPLGFAQGEEGWKNIAAIMSGLVAKEAVISTLGVLYLAEGNLLINTIKNFFNPASAASFMTFNLLFIPCIAAVSTFKAEINSKKWFIFAILFWSFTAWIVSFLIYNFIIIFY